MNPVMQQKTPDPFPRDPFPCVTPFPERDPFP